MILAFKLSDLVTVPFGWLLGVLYEVTSNYGVAMILFALIVQTVLLPIRAKSKKSMMKMSRLQPRIQEIQRKYANDQQKQNEAIQKLQQEEGASMGMGGCLWGLVPMLILIPLFTVIRQPMLYILGESAEVTQQIIDVIKAANADLFSGHVAYEQVIAAGAIPQYAAEIQAAIPGISPDTLAGINFNFLGINLGAIPQFNVFASTWVWDWAHIGLFLIPVVSAGSQLLQMLVSQKTNDSVITNEKGVKDEEVAKNSQTAQSNKMMMWMFPLMSLWIGFTVSAGLSLYWFIGGVYSMISDAIMTKRYRKIYDEEDAERLKRALEADRIEAEKERVRAERRAANPDGITENTSKKKLQKKLRAEEEAAKAAAAKEYAAKKGVVEEEETSDCMSGIPSRPYCKGRNYDPNRYASNSTEE
ncbi:MAG: membrane protein insertase YidC [Oscillospiraceae bacterium]|jgi:YidC/Oxa1 family membrane protein insertase|nr:membrane protein insertase YidC [Oscillospiraceae bacterium]